MEYNRLKIVILSILANESDLCSQDIFSLLEDNIDINLWSVQMALLRFYRYGLLDRWKSGRYYSYSITDKGVDRLNWLKSTMIEEN